MTLTEQIISGKGFSAHEVRSSAESAVVNALQANDDSEIPLDDLDKEARQVFDKISKVNLHQFPCPCLSCTSQKKFFI